jgi:uncharacterized membrane protein HdeD (DUF308 family)
MRDDFFNLKQKTKYWWASLLIGILAIAIGIWCLLTPDVTLVALTMLFIVAFFITGIIDIVYAITNRNILLGWGWNLAGGIIDIILGILLVMLPLPLITTFLVYFVGFWILFRSVWTIGTSIDLQKMGVKGWGWLLALAIIGILFSILFILSPIFSGAFIVAFISIAFMVYGIFRIYYSFKLKSVNNKLKDED